MDLDFVRIECEVTADAPFKLSVALYGSLHNFEEQFKAVSCLNLQQSCSNCSQSIGCPYWIVFSQKLSSNPEIVRLHQKPSLPFSLYINSDDGIVTNCVVGIVVIGSAVNFTRHFYTALLNVIEVGVRTVLPIVTFTLRSYSLDYQATRHEIHHHASIHEQVILLSGKYILQNSAQSEYVKLIFKSPLRLLSNGSIAHRFDFASFFRSQLRRCSSLWAYYGNGDMDLEFVILSEAAQNVTVLENNMLYNQPLWSPRSNRAGLTGTVECAGLAELMLPLLLLGSYFNAGKGATFGNGFYQVEVVM